MLRRFVRATLVVVVGLLLGISLYAGLVKVGLARNPFAPVAGTFEMTLGPTTYGAVVKVHVAAEPIVLPSRSRTPVVTVAV